MYFAKLNLNTNETKALFIIHMLYNNIDQILILQAKVTFSKQPPT